MNDYGNFDLEKELENVPEEELKEFNNFEERLKSQGGSLFSSLCMTVIYAENNGAARKNILLAANDMTDAQRELAIRFYKLGKVHNDMDRLAKIIRYGHD